MKLNDHAESDSLYIKGNLLGIDVDNASLKVDLKRLVLSNLPGKVETAAA